MRILVCGGRDFTKYSQLKYHLDTTLSGIWEDFEEEPIVIIQGGATGADFLAKVYVLDDWEDSDLVSVEEFKADWKKFGKAAGMIRNKQMLDEGKPDLVIAFKGGSGTNNMVDLAEAAGVEVKKVGWDE